MYRRDNLTIPQGSDWAVRWPLLDALGEPVDTAGWKVRSQIRRKVNSAEILHEWATELGNASLADSNLQLSVSNEESSAWKWKTGVFDVELIDNDGHVVRITQGTITVSPEVTR